MRESIKATLAFVFIVSIFVSAILWFGGEQPLKILPLWHFGVPLAGLLALVQLLRMHFARDRVPDFLSTVSRPFFERDGFCFAILPDVADGVFRLSIFFQSKYERQSEAVIAIRPSFGFWLTTRDIQSVLVTIPCQPAGFGCVHVPLPIPREYQGKHQRFDIGATVTYPQRRGRILRFRDGMRVGKHNHRDKAATHLAVTLVTLGQARLSKPATFMLTLPKDVAGFLPNPVDPEIRHHWRLGDSEVPGTLTPVM